MTHTEKPMARTTKTIRSTKRKTVKRPEVANHCRTKYGPLVLWVKPGAADNTYIIYVNDPREQRDVFEREATGTLAAAKEVAVLKAKEYLRGKGDQADFEFAWRCSAAPKV